MKNYLLFILSLILLTSCVSRREVNYVQEIDDKDTFSEYQNVRTQKRIEVYDKVYIKVYNLDPSINDLFQEKNTNQTNINLLSYTVNDKGFIDFPFVGKVHLQGLNIDEAKMKLEQELNSYLPNTSIILRYVGNVITVVGEVNKQGEYAFYDDKINIFQALSYAGGINDYGNKAEVRIIREVDNDITFYEMDLSKKNIVESPYYYLNPNDILVVKPIDAKYRTYRDFALITVILSTISTLVIAVSYIDQITK